MAKAVKSVVKGVTNVVKSVVKAVGAVVSGVVKAVGKVVSAVVNFVASPFMGLFGAPTAASTESETARQQGILVQQQGSNVNIPVVYGFRKVAGTVVFAETGSNNNKYLWVAYVFSEGPVEGIRSIYIDDNLLPADTAGKLNSGQIVDITDTSSKYAGRVRLQAFAGRLFQDNYFDYIGQNSICKEAPSWKSSMTYNGAAVIFARYEWKDIKTQEDSDNNPFGGGIPEIQIELLGRRVASLLTTASESIDYYYDNAYDASIRYSMNPAEILLDYLRNPFYGKGLTNDEIDWPSFRAAAAKCATQVTYVTGLTGPIMTCHTVIDTSQTIFNNVKLLLSNMRGYMPYVQGKYKLKIEDAGNPYDITSGVATIAATFTNDGRPDYTGNPSRNIVGDITYTGIDRTSKYNQYVVNYVDPDQKWSVQQVVYPETEAARQSFITIDGGRENKGEATFSCITNYAIAKDYAKLLFNKSRWSDTVSFKGDSSCFDLEPGDCIYIDGKILKGGTDPTLQAIPWRIVSIKLNNDYTFDIACVRNPDFIYPYTRVGEIDQVIPTYVPKGATIYYPGIVRTPPIGLVPPNSAPWNTGTSTVVVDGVTVTTGTGTTGSLTNPVTVVVPGGTGSDGGTNGTAGTCVAVGQITGNVLSVTAITSGKIQNGMYISGTGVTVNTQVTAFAQNPVGAPSPIVAGELAAGGIGTYRVDKTQTVAAGTTLNFSLVAATSNPPTPPTPPKPLEDVIKIDNVSYLVEGGLIYATLTFQQPNHPMYESTVIWYKRSIASETVWKTAEITDVPGGARNITYKLGPLIKGYYTIKSRVKYNTKEFSKFVGTAQIDATGVLTSQDPVDYVETAGEGWSLPTTPGENKRNTYIDKVIGTPLLTSGAPRNPRQMSLTLTQDINTNGVNGLIAGVTIYWKSNALKYWNTAKVSFPSSYVEGSPYTFELPFTLGAVGALQLYDFCIRYRYTDGTESGVQYRSMGARVQTDPFGAVSFDPFYYVSPAAQGRESVSAYELITVENAPPGAISDPREIKFSFMSIENRQSPNRIQYFIDTPSTEDLASIEGVRIYSKEILSTSTSIVTTDITPLTNASGQRSFSLNINFDSIYEYVIVPLVSYNGAQTEGTQAWYVSGYIHNRTGDADYPATGNWMRQLTMEQGTKSAMYAKIGTATPAGPNRFTLFDAVSFTELLTGGNPRDPRDISFTIRQTAGSVQSPNRITGVKIYYKPVSFSYWYSVTHTLAGYTQGSNYTFTFPGDIGSPTATPTAINSGYDFILRFTYDDGSESIKQARGQGSVQGGSYPITFSNLQETASSYIFVPVENAPAGAVTDPRTMTLSFDQSMSMASNREQAILFYINTPVDPTNKWAGVRLYARPVVPGSNTAFIATDYFPVPRDANGRLLVKLTIDYAQGYEYVLVPVVLHNRVRTECNSAWYGKGQIDANLDTSGRVPNWFQLLKFELIDTSVALNRMKEVFLQTDSTVQVQNWSRVQTSPNGGNIFHISYYYYELKFCHTHITNYNELDIYRRIRIPGVGPVGTTLHFGTGRWEKMTVTTVNNTPGGTVTVNLRAPIDSTEFASYFTGFPETTYNKLINQQYVTNKPCGSVGQLEEFLLVVKSNSAYSTKALYMPVIQPVPLVGRIDGLNGTRPQIVDVAVYNTGYTANYLRNLTDARTAVASANLINKQTGTLNPGLPSTTPTII